MESDSGLVLEVLTWWQQRQQPAASAAVGGATTVSPLLSSSSSSLSPPPTESLGVHTIMALAPHASKRYELLPSFTWRGPAARALREKGRVRSNAAAVTGGGGSRFFSDAWVFRTATGACVWAFLLCCFVSMDGEKSALCVGLGGSAHMHDKHVCIQAAPSPPFSAAWASLLPLRLWRMERGLCPAGGAAWRSAATTKGSCGACHSKCIEMGASLH